MYNLEQMMKEMDEYEKLYVQSTSQDDRREGYMACISQMKMIVQKHINEMRDNDSDEKRLIDAIELDNRIKNIEVDTSSSDKPEVIVGQVLDAVRDVVSSMPTVSETWVSVEDELPPIHPESIYTITDIYGNVIRNVYYDYYKHPSEDGEPILRFHYYVDELMDFKMPEVLAWSAPPKAYSAPGVEYEEEPEWDEDDDW